ncbi:MAG: hypothetical protein OXJ52_08340, partial [Oligoflexia bacterium]|nr:hypothetical protein [Oligoflexia bacterium]
MAGPSFPQKRESPEKTSKLNSNQYKYFGLFLCAFFFTGCALGVNQTGVFQQVLSRSLSLNEPELRTCVFDPYYSVVHFPMYHDPPVKNYSTQTYELVVKSQFQLLHTLIDYHRSARPLAVFDERITSDSYNLSYVQAIERGLAESDTYTRFNGTVFYFAERYKTANRLFGQGFPSYYEYLNELQKKFLFNTGASLTLYLLKEIPQIHKVISPRKLKLFRANLVGDITNSDSLKLSENYYWVFTFRDMELRREVDTFYQRNSSYRYNGLVFIAYGANHDFSDDFAGLPFQSGHDF